MIKNIWKWIVLLLAGCLAIIFGRSNNSEKITDIIDSIDDKSPTDKVELGNELLRKGKSRAKRKPSDLFF